MARIGDHLTRLATLSPADLRAEWQEVEGEAAPDLPPSLLRRALAYRLQEQSHGRLPAAVQRMLIQLSCDPSAKPVEPEIRLKPGTRLLREWNGKLHTVHVTEDGLWFEERRYRSMSHVAREITGAQWSGPRFFGLRKPVHPPLQGAARG
ncbi:hypothetical protein ASE86_12200 [Sphingomonas sp. Leaf33]|uniref:DUF2924 domain-containing protein n=1 Tax=Sphingomonas sp. Leaf33 TaxID=1736215 RepID=UPI0006FCF463|nr:DUF2924 domain-containing protein [Sphingomonas sp. Leaf33]KQN19268.1 hypothetical protein ASE86_12200 [Sphingomonas sp. Leaf33]